MKTNMSSMSLLVSAAAGVFVTAQIHIASSTINAADPGPTARRRRRRRAAGEDCPTINSSTSTPVRPTSRKRRTSPRG